MKFSVALASLALGAAAAPSAPPKFAIQITAKVDGKDTSLFLAKGATGAGAADIKDAASCSINDKTNLVCDGKIIGAAPAIGGYVDMAPLAPVSGEGAMTDGFSVDANNVLHWKSSKFAALPQVGKTIMEKQNGEAEWGLFKSFLSGNKPQLYSQLGCPGGTHNGLHAEVVVGTNKVVAL